MDNLRNIENMRINTMLENACMEKDRTEKKQKRLLFKRKCLMIVIDYACEFKKKYPKCDYHSLLKSGIEAFEEKLSNFYSKGAKDHNNFAENVREHIKFVMEDYIAKGKETKEQISINQNYVINRLLYQLYETPYEINEESFENPEKEVIMLELERLYMTIIFDCASLFREQNPEYYINYFIARGIKALNNIDISKITQEYVKNHAEFMRGYLSDCFSEQLIMDEGKERTEKEHLEDELIVLETFYDIDTKLAQYGMENPFLCALRGYSTYETLNLTNSIRERLEGKKPYQISNK